MITNAQDDLQSKQRETELLLFETQGKNPKWIFSTGNRLCLPHFTDLRDLKGEAGSQTPAPLSSIAPFVT
ncbi:MAG: hypothetical protein QGH15_05145 [Kiritimatiellia bacterium]|jgi:hypothetical protein|nr:hypothetical protein [Kiritimatiellia bacterium]